MQERLTSLRNLHTLRFANRDTVDDSCCQVPFDAVAECPVLRVLDLGNGIALTFPGNTPEAAVERLAESRLVLFEYQCRNLDVCTVCTPKYIAMCCHLLQALGFS